MPVSQKIRPSNALHFAREPDFIHDIFGHFPVLFSEEYRDLLSAWTEQSSFLPIYEGDRANYHLNKMMVLSHGHVSESCQKQYKAQEGDYLQDREESNLRSPMDYSLELTRPFRSLRIWLAWKYYGPSLLANALREKYLLAQFCRDEFQKIPHLKILAPLDLSIFAFSIDWSLSRQYRITCGHPPRRTRRTLSLCACRCSQREKAVSGSKFALFEDQYSSEIHGL